MDKTEAIKLQRTPSNNSGLRIVGSGTNLSLMGDPYTTVDTENTMTSSRVNKPDHPLSSASAAGGSLGSFPVRRESTSMADVTSDTMYLQQRKCETCSSLIMPPIRSNW